MEIHPAANAFPMLGKDDLAELTEDIRRNGLIVPIELYEGKVIDGRNRLQACEQAGVEPEFVEIDLHDGMSPAEYVWSLNGARRHLTPGQKAAIAVGLLPVLEAEAKERKLSTLKQNADPEKIPDRDCGESREQAAAIVGTNERYVSDAKRIQEADPDLFEQVKSGEVKLTEAKRRVRAAQLAKGNAPLPKGKHAVIYADPPWCYNDKQGGDISDNYGGAEKHYPSMKLAQLKDLDVQSLSADDCVLFLWVTAPLLPHGLELASAWGFTYKSHFIWDKVKHNMGHYNSVRHELLLVCTKGKATPQVTKLFDSVQSIERSKKHSEKPERFREIIDTLYPKGARIELFRRGELPSGWRGWGNECK